MRQRPKTSSGSLPCLSARVGPDSHDAPRELQPRRAAPRARARPPRRGTTPPFKKSGPRRTASRSRAAVTRAPASEPSTDAPRREAATATAAGRPRAAGPRREPTREHSPRTRAAPPPSGRRRAAAHFADVNSRARSESPRRRARAPERAHDQLAQTVAPRLAPPNNSLTNEPRPPPPRRQRDRPCASGTRGDAPPATRARTDVDALLDGVPAGRPHGLQPDGADGPPLARRRVAQRAHALDGGFRGALAARAAAFQPAVAEARRPRRAEQRLDATGVRRGGVEGVRPRRSRPFTASRDVEQPQRRDYGRSDPRGRPPAGRRSSTDVSDDVADRSSSSDESSRCPLRRRRVRAPRRPPARWPSCASSRAHGPRPGRLGPRAGVRRDAPPRPVSSVSPLDLSGAAVAATATAAGRRRRRAGPDGFWWRYA